MPYIKQEQRELMQRQPGFGTLTTGELNYAITRLLQQYLDTKGCSYSTINDIVGALEGAKLEFYRRIAAPYEDKKISENGDVYYVEGVTTHDH